MEEGDLSLKNSVLLLEERRLFLKLRELIALIDVCPKRNDQVEQEPQEDYREHRPTRGEVDSSASDSGRSLFHSGSSFPATRRGGWRLAYRAVFPSSPSMRSSWLYLAVRSLRVGAPALI